MPFFKDLRRKSKSFRMEKEPNGNIRSKHSDGAVPTTKSSSTVDSAYGSSTPPSSVRPETSTPSLSKSKSQSTMATQSQRPVAMSSLSNRNSVVVCHVSERVPAHKDPAKRRRNSKLTSHLCRDLLLRHLMDPYLGFLPPPSRPEYYQSLTILGCVS